MAKRVLLVDDNPTIRKAMRTWFESSGFECVEAEDGLDALAQAGHSYHDLIILDLSMPRMNGLEAAPKLRELHPRTPIILFTMFSGTVLVEEATAAGINRVVSKDESVASLIQHAQELLG